MMEIDRYGLVGSDFDDEMISNGMEGACHTVTLL